jgi:hypothetical protein
MTHDAIGPSSDWLLEAALKIAAAIAGDNCTEIHTSHHREQVAAWSVDLAERVWTNAKVPAELRDAA